MQTRSQGLRFFSTEQDLYASKGNLNILPHHIRMQIYRIHIQNTDDTSILAITKTCRGIYAEIHQEIRNKMFDKIYSTRVLAVRSKEDAFRDKLPVLKFGEDSYGFAFLQTESFIPPAYNNITIILNALTSLQINIRLPWSQLYKPFKASMTQMMKYISSELVQLTELRIPCISVFGYRRDTDDEELQRQNLYIVLGPLLLIPTVRLLRCNGGYHNWYVTRQPLLALLEQLEIKYEIVVKYKIEEDFIIKLFK
jgi:hypothetical protein